MKALIVTLVVFAAIMAATVAVYTTLNSYRGPFFVIVLDDNNG